MSQSRQLAAIMFTDIVGYTALMGKDEHLAFALLNENRSIQKPVIEEFGGTLVKELGDGILASFNTVSDALHAAIKIQQTCMTGGAVSLRVAIHYGEVIVEDQDVFGDAVNVASRMQALGTPGSVLISQKVQDEIENRAEFQTTPIGSFRLKNIRRRIAVLALTNPGLTIPELSLVGFTLGHIDRRILIPVLVLVLLAGGFVIYRYVYHGATPSDKSIAVLPFTNMSGDKEQEYFSDGIMEEILNQLAKIRELTVVSRTSSMLYRDSKLSLKDIAKELGVVNILEGSVRKADDKIRITVQLIDARADKHLWSQTFDHEMLNIFAIQTDIAVQTAKALKANLSIEEQQQIEKPSTESAEAYQLYLKGRFLWNKRLQEPLMKSIGYFLQATEKDSTYALAYAGLGDAYLMLGVHGILPPKESLPLAKDYIQKALKIDSTLSEAYATLVDINIHYDWDVDAAETNFKKAIAFNAGYANAYHWHSEVLMMRGEFDEAIQESEKALEIEPYSLVINTQLGANYAYMGEFKNAVDQLQKCLEFDSTFALAQYNLGIAYTALDKPGIALRHLQKAVALAPEKTNLLAALGFAEAAAGNHEKALEIEQTILQESQHKYVPPFDLAVIELGVGKSDSALEYLEQEFAERGPWMPFLGMHPLFRGLKDNPKFQALLEKIVPDADGRLN